MAVVKFVNLTELKISINPNHLADLCNAKHANNPNNPNDLLADSGSVGICTF